MNKIFLVGSIPPPIGGVTIHLDRFLNLYSTNKFNIAIFDIKKMGLFEKNKQRSSLLSGVLFYLSSKIVHIHVSNDYVKIFFAIMSKALLKKVIYTHHNSIVKKEYIFKLMYKVCDKVILVNDKEINPNLIQKNKTAIIPAFLPPYQFATLPNYLTEVLNKYENIISTNCYFYNLIGGKHVYGFDLVIDAFHRLSESDKIKNTALILVDPSNTTKDFVNDLLDGLDFKDNKVLLITDKIDFVSLVKKSTLTIRATRTDGDSLSIRESLYLNIPIIASNITWRPSGTILFNNNDSKDLSDKISDTLINPVIHDYLNDDYGEKIIDLYDTILN